MDLVINCTGATTVNLDELHELQGNLKDLSETNYVKLRNSLTQFGFSFPIFVWEDIDGTKYILDAHQRRKTLLKMREEGWNIPQLPAVYIIATSKLEAKKKLLLLNSRYGEITEEGMTQFVNEVGLEIPGDDPFIDLLELPELDLGAGESTEDTNDTENKEDKTIVCPACQHTFKL